MLLRNVHIHVISGIKFFSTILASKSKHPRKVNSFNMLASTALVTVNLATYFTLISSGSIIWAFLQVFTDHCLGIFVVFSSALHCHGVVHGVICLSVHLLLIVSIVLISSLLLVSGHTLVLSSVQSYRLWYTTVHLWLGWCWDMGHGQHVGFSGLRFDGNNFLDVIIILDSRRRTGTLGWRRGFSFSGS